MKTLLILVASLLGGCAITSAPEFPGIKDHYMVEVRNEEVPVQLLSAIVNLNEIPEMRTNEVARCMHFEIVSRVPYKIKFTQQVPMKSCHLVGGYKPKDAQSLYNWVDDMAAWAETRKKCFK